MTCVLYLPLEPVSLFEIANQFVAVKKENPTFALLACCLLIYVNFVEKLFANQAMM